MPQEIFFGKDDNKLTYGQILEVRRICMRCPVMVDCLVESFRYEETHGIWAGITGRERASLVSKHRNTDMSVKEALRLIWARCAMDRKRVRRNGRTRIKGAA